jgi:hypothetical protein
MSRRTRRLLLLALTAATAAGLLAAWWLWPRTAITPENFERVQIGMTLAEVEAILGGPARDETTGPLEVVTHEEAAGPQLMMWPDSSGDASQPTDGQLPAARVWSADGLTVQVDLDPQGRVIRKARLPFQRGCECPLDSLRRWLGL